MRAWYSTLLAMQFTRWQIIGLALLTGVIFLITATVTFMYASFRQVSVTPNVVSDQVITEPEASPDPLRPYSILLLGYGGGRHAGGRLTDTVMVARVDPRAQTVHLISIPRDTWISFPSSAEGETYWKINAAYAIGSDQRGYASRPEQFKGDAGGGELAKYAVSKVVGFPIDHFVAINFAGFERSIDVLGGVNIRVERTFDDFFYPIEGLEDDTCEKSPEEIEAVATMSAEQAEREFPCRYEHLHFDAGMNHMDGATALKYVRSRHGTDGNDFGRAARQRALLSAVRDRVFEVNFIPKALPFVATLAGNVQMDIPLSKLQEWLGQAQEFREYQIFNVALTDKNVLRHGRSNNGQYIMMPQTGIDAWGPVHEYIQDEIAATATQSATGSASKLE